MRTFFSPAELQILIPGLVVLLLLAFLAHFLRRYWMPARRVRRHLSAVARKVELLSEQPSGERRLLLNQVFTGTPFERTWQEYQDTLHDQTAVVDGELQVFRTRSTAKASYFFNTQNTVETPTRSEYFKHLPGILTGIGIIGTFAGLLIGLNSFDPDPARVQDSLRLLLAGVRDAFFASAFAITAAMLITHLEKTNYRACVQALETLTDAIDRLFDAGVGEEYLAELVRHTQESSVQTRQLKDSLVTDLRSMLQNLVDTQVRENLRLAETLSTSYREASTGMASSISESIERSFREPLDQIAKSVQSATGDQSGKVQSLLQDVLMAFMQKLEDSFGNQFTGMQSMLNASITSMEEMRAGFVNLVHEMRSAGESSTQAIHQQLSATLQEMHGSQRQLHEGMQSMLSHIESTVSTIGLKGEEAGQKMADQLMKLYADSESRQTTMVDQMQAFVGTLKDAVGKGHEETVGQITQAVGVLETRLTGMLDSMESSRSNMDQKAAAAQEELQAGTERLLAQLGGQVRELLSSFAQSQEVARDVIVRLEQQTARHIASLESGAEKMRLAAGEFVQAGDKVSGTSTALGDLAAEMNGSATGISKASSELGAVISDYRASRDATLESTRLLEGVIANAQAEAGMRGRVLEDMKRMSDQLQDLNGETRQYLEQVTGVLSSAFETFGKGVEGSLAKSLTTFDTELSSALEALGGGVQDLSENVDTLGDIISKSVRRQAV